MSAYEVTGSWKSPRKVQEEINLYQRKRFEDYMEMEDMGLLTRELALAALREELEYEPPTQPIDLNKLRKMLGDD